MVSRYDFSLAETRVSSLLYASVALQSIKEEGGEEEEEEADRLFVCMR